MLCQHINIHAYIHVTCQVIANMRKLPKHAKSMRTCQNMLTGQHCEHAYMPTYVPTCKHTSQHTSIHPYIPTCIHANIHTNIHLNIPTYINATCHAMSRHAMLCQHTYIHVTCQHTCKHAKTCEICENAKNNVKVKLYFSPMRKVKLDFHTRRKAL